MLEHWDCAVRWINKRIGPSRDEIRAKREKLKEKYQSEKKEVKKLEEKMREIAVIYGKDSAKFKRERKKYEKKKKKLKRLKKRYKHEDFNSTMSFLDLDLEYEHVLTFSIFFGLLSFILSLVFFVIMLYFMNWSMYEIIIFGTPILTVIPCVSIILASIYPDMAEKRLKSDCLGKLPEAINYMTMSLRVNPSLSRAIKFSANNTEGPISKGLKQITWQVYMKEKIHLEESFLNFTSEWGEWNDNLKRALYAVRAALLEKTDDGFRNALKRANDVIIEGAKQDVKKFSESLRIPTSILFALGILLPMIIGAMLPIVALGGLDVTAMTAEEGSGSSPLTLPVLILLMNIIFPLISFGFSFYIIGKRPGTKRPLEVQTMTKKAPHLCISGILVVSGLLVLSNLHASLNYLMPIPYFFVFALPISYYLLATSFQEKRKRKKMLKMERQFPSLLFQLGSRIAEGLSLEKAFLKTSKSLKGNEITGLTEKITNTMKISQLSLKKTLFGDNGILDDHPSKSIRTGMKTVIQISEKDPETAGKSVMRIANYKEELQRLDEEMKNMLSKSIQMMKGTALFFAPFTMGILSSLYFMLEDIFSGLGNFELVSPIAFSTVMGVYVLLMGAVIIYFTKSIESSLDLIEFKYEYGKTMLVSIVIYSVALLLGRLLIGTI